MCARSGGFRLKALSSNLKQRIIDRLAAKGPDTTWGLESELSVSRRSMMPALTALERDGFVTSTGQTERLRVWRVVPLWRPSDA